MFVTCIFEGCTMGNVACAYENVGRHEDALATRKNTLAYFRRVLPHNHPYIGVIPLPCFFNEFLLDGLCF